MFFSLSLIAIPRECGALSEKNKKTDYQIGLHFESRGGVGSAQTLDFANSIINVAVKDYGYTVKIVNYPSDYAVMEAFVRNRIEGALIWSEMAADTIVRGAEFYPWASFTIGNKPKASACLWQLKSNPIKKPEDIIGKTYLSENYAPMKMVGLREILLSQGIDKPLWKVFKSFTKVPGNNSAFMAVAMGKADFTMEFDDNGYYLKVLSPGVGSKLRHTFCTEAVYSRGTILFNKKKVSRESFAGLSATLKDFLENKYEPYMKSKPEMQSLAAFLKMSTMKFVQATPDTFKAELALYNKAKARKWLDEAEFMNETMEKAPMGQSVEIKPTFVLCKNLCKSAGVKLECVDHCMK